MSEQYASVLAPGINHASDSNEKACDGSFMSEARRFRGCGASLVGSSALFAVAGTQQRAAQFAPQCRWVTWSKHTRLRAVGDASGEISNAAVHRPGMQTHRIPSWNGGAARHSADTARRNHSPRVRARAPFRLHPEHHNNVCAFTVASSRLIRAYRCLWSDLLHSRGTTLQYLQSVRRQPKFSETDEYPNAPRGTVQDVSQNRDIQYY